MEEYAPRTFQLPRNEVLETTHEAEIDIRQLFLRLWQGWPILLATTIVAAILGTVLYFVVPPTYRSQATILPVTEAEYDSYVNLMASSALPAVLRDPSKGHALLNTAFDYKREDLLNEFLASLTPERLIPAVEESGVARKEGQQQATEESILTFIRSIRITPPSDSKPGFEMEVRARDEAALNRFMKQALGGASTEAATRIRQSVLGKIGASEKIRTDAIDDLQVELVARRRQQEDARSDQIAKLSEQAKIAGTVGIVSPVAAPSASSAQSAPAASAQVIDSKQPDYLQGSVALNEQIDLLRNRKDNDPFTEDLRNMERQIYVLQNDGQAARLRAMLDESPLKDPATAPIAHFSTVTAQALKVFPRLSVFGIGSILLGLLIGTGIVLLRTERREK